MSHLTITAIVLTYNEELHIERCIRNLQKVCERIYVVDSYSTDRTCEIARECDAIVAQHRYVNQAQQFQWALENCEITSEWTMRMDADEYLTDKLIDEIKEKAEGLDETISGINFTLRVKFMRHLLRFGMLKNITILRMWRTGHAYVEQRWMDERMVLKEGKTIKFKHYFIDENLNGLTAWTQKHNNYSNREIITELDKRYDLFSYREASELKNRNRQKSLYYKFPRFLRATLYFLARYICFLGFLDGIPGLVWLTLQTYWYRFLVDAKMLEMEKILGKEPSRQQVIEYICKYYGIQIE